jgi:3-hydroxyisobutyrate dehydrogenase-like beta-hydroxyacid dehydrogenase
MSGHLAMIGFGEAGETFARAGQWGSDARAFDVLPQRAAAIRAAGLTPCDDADAALSRAGVVLSLVTADQALAAARLATAYLEPEALWCDCNSVAPDTKRSAAREIARAGVRYVDVAILAPVQPAGLAVPMLLSGPDAKAARDALASLGFANLRVVGDEVGRASAIKMIRSIMIKGIEALTAEMMLAAEAAGVADEVLASLDASEHQRPWRERTDYNLERMRTHGLRRAAEMEEVANTLDALGVAPVMTRGAVRRQREMATGHDERSAA